MKYIPLMVTIIFLFIGLGTLYHYGMTWDSPHRFMRGQYYLHYMLTGRQTFNQPSRLSPDLITPGTYMTRYDFLSGEQDQMLSLPTRPLPQIEFKNLHLRGSFYQSDWWSGKYFLTLDPVEYGHFPLPELLGAISNRFFFETLHLVGDIESYHIPFVAISAIGVFVVTLFVWQITNSALTGMVSGMILAFFPIFFAESHFNLKDPLQASLYAGSIWAFWHWISTSKLRWFSLSLSFVVLTLSVKWNVVFLPFILLFWLFTVRKSPEFSRWFKPKRLIVLACIASVVCIAFLTAIWPMAWQNPLAAFMGVVRFYWGIGATGDSILPPGFILPGGFNAYPLLLLLVQTPEVVLVLLAIGIVAVLRGKVGRELRVGYLILFWLLIPIIRYSLPGARVYSGYRQIFEILPAISVIAGLGIYTILRIKSSIVKKSSLVLILLLTGLFVVDILRIHPNENAYFNRFIGGIRGAYQKGFIDFFLTNGNVYRQGATWLNTYAPKDSNVALLDGRMVALSPLYLRDDISFSPDHFSGFARKGEYILFIDTQLEKPIFSYQYLRRFLHPVATISVDGVSILSIYKNESKYIQKGFETDRALNGVKETIIPSIGGDFLELDVGRDELITKIALSAVAKGCQSTNTFSRVDEVISFIPENQSASFSLRDSTYGLLERTDQGDGNVEYYFPAQKARYIRIYPKSEASCFASGKIRSVYVL